MQQYQGLTRDDTLANDAEEMQERFNAALRDKKVKDHMIKREKEKKLAKAKQMGTNNPLKNYYRE